MRLVFAALLLALAGADLAIGGGESRLDYAALCAGGLILLTAAIDRLRPIGRRDQAG